MEGIEDSHKDLTFESIVFEGGSSLICVMLGIGKDLSTNHDKDW